MERARTTGPAGTHPWDGWSLEEGYGVPPVRFPSGDLLALRVGPGGAEVWHRAPGRGWTTHEGAHVTRRGRELVARAPAAGLTWTLHLRSSPLTRLANAEVERVSFEIRGPAGSGPRVGLRVRGSGSGDEAPPATGGVQALLRPHRLWVVGASEAVVAGRSLGGAASAPVALLGGFFPWRAPGVLVEGALLTRARTTAAATGLRRAS